MSRPKKKSEPPEPTAEAPPVEPQPAYDWSCSECGAPGLYAAFRTKTGHRCWTCFFDSPSKEVATFEHRK